MTLPPERQTGRWLTPVLDDGPNEPDQPFPLAFLFTLSEARVAELMPYFGRWAGMQHIAAGRTLNPWRDRQIEGFIHG